MESEVLWKLVETRKFLNLVQNPFQQANISSSSNLRPLFGLTIRTRLIESIGFCGAAID